MFSERVKRIEGSQTMEIAAKAIAMREQGKRVLDFSVGEPDFPTPDIVKEAGKRAIDENLIKYTVSAGLLELREEICRKLEKENGLRYQPSQILVSTGAKQSIFNAILALAERGDDVLIPAPYYVSYPEMVKFSGANPLIIPTKEREGFKLSAGMLEESITKKSKILILCNPSNPSGLLYSREELSEIISVVKKHDLFVISDEVYEKLVYDRSFCSFASVEGATAERTIIINGASKAFAMTGWRLGYAAASREIIAAMNKIQSHSTSGTSTIAQYAAIAALKYAEEDLVKMVVKYRERRDVILNYLDKIPQVSYAKPDGAFYVFPNISRFFGKRAAGYEINNSFDMALYLLETAGVNTVPGAVFGSDDHLRIAYAASMEIIHEGMRALTAGLGRLAG